MKHACLMGLLGTWLITLAGTLAGCSWAALPATKTAATKKTASALLPEAAQWRVKRQNGIDFVAAGITPAEWSMDVDFSRQILFKPQNGVLLTADMPKPQPIGRHSGVLLDARTGSGMVAATSRKAYAVRPSRLKVFIEPNAVRDNLTGRTYAYTVRVETNGRRYQGYGSFIKGSDRLDGTWTLETFKGQRLREGQFASRELPQLTISLTDNTVEGTTGCNKLKGEIAAEGDHVQFTVKSTTNKKCSDGFEEAFLEALQQATLFRIGKDRLTLLVNSQYVMTLVKGQ